MFKFHKLFTNLDKLIFKVSARLGKEPRAALFVISISKQIDKGIINKLNRLMRVGVGWWGSPKSQCQGITDILKVNKEVSLIKAIVSFTFFKRWHFLKFEGKTSFWKQFLKKLIFVGNFSRFHFFFYLFNTLSYQEFCNNLLKLKNVSKLYKVSNFSRKNVKICQNFTTFQIFATCKSFKTCRKLYKVSSFLVIASKICQNFTKFQAFL